MLDGKTTASTSVKLSDLLQQEIYPRLSVETIYTDPAHKFANKTESKWQGGCPWHKSESGTSWYADCKSLLWFCPGCGFGGSPVEYLDRLGGGDGSPTGRHFVDIVRKLCGMAGVPFPERELSEEEQEQARKRDRRRGILQATAELCCEVLWSDAGESARAYLQARGFDLDGIKSLGLGLYPSIPTVRKRLLAAGYAADELNEIGVLWPDLQGYVVFPWQDDYAAPLTLYGRWPDKKPADGRPKTIALPNPKEDGEAWEASKRSPLYFDRARAAHHKEIVLVEGVIDTALAQIRGDTRVVACVGAQLSHEQTVTLARHKIKSVIIALDPDQAGDSGIRSCCNSLLKAGITPYVAPRLPDGMDPDEFILAHGIDGWREHVSKALNAFRYKAQLILKSHKPEDGWTDQTQDDAITAAVKHASDYAEKYADELSRHFWPEIVKETGADREALLERVSRLRGQASNGKAHETAGPAQAAEPTAVDSPPVAPPWPEPVSEEAYYGLAGEIVRAIEPETEADPVAILAQIKVAMGNVIGRTAHFRVEDTPHYLNEFFVLVGDTGKARKGTSQDRAKRAFAGVDPAWHDNRILGGLSSGEGVVWHVRDPIISREKVKERGRVTAVQEYESDPGITDKRLLVVEPEFANVLRQIERSGNILSATLRQAWDGSQLGTLTKNAAVKATGAHISLIGHITGDELRRMLSSTEAASGFGNRFGYLSVRRSKCLPEGGKPVDMTRFTPRLKQAVEFACKVGQLAFDPEAREIWHGIYPKLSEGKPGLAGVLLARAEAHVLRLACLDAVLDCSKLVKSAHLFSALALWSYCERSVRFIFGNSLGDALADEILDELRRQPKGMTRTEISKLFSGNQQKDRIARALGLLHRAGMACPKEEATGGRPVERWFAAPGA